MNYTKYIIHLYNRAKKRKYMFSPTIWYCPSDKFVSASIASMAKISVSMQTKHLHTVWMTHFDINLTVAAVYIICVRVWASASWFVLWLNTTLYVLSSILRIKLVLVCSCVCVCIHAINYNIVCILAIKKYDAFVQITAIRTFCIRQLIALSSRDIECYLTSIYLALSWINSYTAPFDSRPTIFPFVMFNLRVYKSCWLHFHFGLNGLAFILFTHLRSHLFYSMPMLTLFRQMYLPCLLAFTT